MTEEERRERRKIQARASWHRRVARGYRRPLDKRPAEERRADRRAKHAQFRDADNARSHAYALAHPVVVVDGHRYQIDRLPPVVQSAFMHLRDARLARRCRNRLDRLSRLERPKRMAMTPEQKRDYMRQYYQEHRETMLRRANGWYLTHRDEVLENRVSLGGEQMRIPTLPPELQSVALLIKETRREIRERGARNV